MGSKKGEDRGLKGRGRGERREDKAQQRGFMERKKRKN
jgi:hypothetical protein